MKTAMIIFLILVVIALIILVPYGVLWSLNTLFPVLVIPYTVKTWIASFILAALVWGPSSTQIQKK